MLSAIMEDQAIIDGQLIKVGGRVGKATLVEIGTDYVKIFDDNSATREIMLYQPLQMMPTKPGK